MSRYIVGHEEQNDFDAGLVGNKAFYLRTLIEIGCKVPPFFCVTSFAYLDFLEERGFPTYIRKFSSESLSSKDLEYFLSIAKEVRHYILTKPLLPSIEDEILKGLGQFKKQSGSISFAVRSSGIQEDSPDFSMAGQLKTFLNLRENAEILDAIRECWASLWRGGVIKYLVMSKGIDREIPSMGVIIQEMIVPESSGVLFTVNPVSQKNEIMVEGVRGLGDLLVKGRVTPDNYTLDKEGFSMSINAYGRQEFLATVDETGGDIIAKPVPAEVKDKRVLSGTKLRALAETALLIEKHFGTPQNIEWACRGDEFYFLQTRPLTLSREPLTKSETDGTPEKEKEGRERKIKEMETIWTKHFFDERFPMPVSPLSWSILKDLLERRAFVDPLEYQGFRDARRYEITRLFYGRPYTNLSVFYRLFYYYPSFLVSKDTERFFPKREYIPCYHRRFPWLHPNYLLALTAALIKDRQWLIPVHLKKWEQFLEEYREALLELEEVPVAAPSPKELFDDFTKTRTLINDFLKIHRWSIAFADILYHLSLCLIRRWRLPEKLLTLPCRESGDKKNMTMEVNKDIRKLAKEVFSSPVLKQLFMEHETGSLMEKLGGMKEADDFLSRLKIFLQSYGHRSNSLDLCYPSWKEDPEYILGIIKSLVTEDDLEEGESVEKVILKEELKKHLSVNFLDRVFPLRAFLLKKLIVLVQAFVLLRENQRFYWQFSMAHMRRLLLEMGKCLTKKLKNVQGEKVLDSLSDIFFLRIQELYNLLIEETKKIDCQAIIDERKKEWFENSRIEAPSFILLENGKEKEFFVEQGDKGVLKGLGVSPGKISGKACVLKDLQDHSKIRKGDILVTVALDPGWVHIFPLISGLVLEVGGLLSHGSIIAREFGIPAVVNIDRATERISSGENISLDGTEGFVEFRQ
jgi:phosphoenolpyruvate synthase/pyruvate phosphate dikinase